MRILNFVVLFVVLACNPALVWAKGGHGHKPHPVAAPTN